MHQQHVFLLRAPPLDRRAAANDLHAIVSVARMHQHGLRGRRGLLHDDGQTRDQRTAASASEKNRERRSEEAARQEQSPRLDEAMFAPLRLSSSPPQRRVAMMEGLVQVRYCPRPMRCLRSKSSSRPRARPCPQLPRHRYVVHPYCAHTLAVLWHRSPRGNTVGPLYKDSSTPEHGPFSGACSNPPPPARLTPGG